MGENHSNGDKGLMKTRKPISAFACLTILIVCIASFCFTGCSKGVRINEQNFPDDVFRNYLLNKEDHNGDKYLTADQLLFIKGISLEGCENLEGIEYLTSLNSLSLTNCKDLSGVEKATNISTLKLVDCKNVDIDFSKLTNLHKLSITNCDVTVDIDLSGSQTIDDIEIKESTVRNVILNECAILYHVYIHESSADTVKMSNCPYMNSFTVDEVQNLSSVEITECEKMGSAYIVRCPDLKELSFRECTTILHLILIYCDGVKEVDVRGCKYLWEVFNTPDALETLDSSVKPGYVILCVDDYPTIRDLHLPQIRIECLPDVEFITI